jgi:hypothetical protein
VIEIENLPSGPAASTGDFLDHHTSVAAVRQKSNEGEGDDALYLGD